MVVILLFSFFAHPIKVDTVETHIVKQFGEKPPDEYILGIINDVEYYKGLLFVVDMKENRIMVYDTLGNFIREIGKPGQGPGEFLYPKDIKIWKDTIYVTDEGNQRIEMFDINGRFLSSFVPKKRGVYSGKPGIWRGKIYLTTIGNDRLITVYNLSGKEIGFFGNPASPPKNKDIAIWDLGTIMVNEGNLYYFYYAIPLIQIYDLNGKFLGRIKVRSHVIKRLRTKQKKYLKKETSNMRGTMYPILHDVNIWNGKIYYLCFYNLHILSSSGEVEKIIYIRPKTRRHGFDQFAIDDNGKIWVVTPYEILWAKP